MLGNSAKTVEPRNSRSVKRKSDPGQSDTVKEDVKQVKLIQLACTAPDAMSKNPTQSAARSRPKRQQKEIVHVTFTEDENTLDMSINADAEDSLCHSDDEDEVELPPSQSSSSQTDTDSSEESNDNDEQPVRPERASPKVTMKPLSNQQKLCALDLEMKQKMKDIHKIMAQGGLNETVEYMNKHFTIGSMEANPDGSGRSPKGRQGNTSNNHLSLNMNQNRLTGVPQIVSNSISDKSVETIYQNAVSEKQDSSSSGDCIDISDESLQIEGFISEISDRQQGGSRCDDDTLDRRDDREYNPRRQPPPQTSPEEKANQLIWEAEAAKAKIYSLHQVGQLKNRLLTTSLLHKWMKTTL